MLTNGHLYEISDSLTECDTKLRYALAIVEHAEGKMSRHYKSLLELKAHLNGVLDEARVLQVRGDAASD